MICRICKANEGQKHEECLLEGEWSGVPSENDVRFLMEIIRKGNHTANEKLSASLFLQACVLR